MKNTNPFYFVIEKENNMALNKELVEKNLNLIREAYRNGNQEFIIAFFLYEINEMKKEDITEDIINKVDSILDETENYYDEDMRDSIKNIKVEMLQDKFTDSLTNYIDNVTEQEWKKLLKEYNVLDLENYMGEVRRKIEERIMIEFEYAEEERQEEMLMFFSKYDDITKEQEEELER